MPSTDQICPYCFCGGGPPSKDHIFPQFLGGTRKTYSCQSCNSLFGHSFEGQASKILQGMHVFISSWGLPLRSCNPIWENAHVEAGKTYDLSVGEIGVKPTLAKPVFEFDEEGHVITALFPDKKSADHFAERYLSKGKAKKLNLEKVNEQPSLNHLGHFLTLGPDLKKTALKMGLALSTTLPGFQVKEIEVGSSFLHSEKKPDNVLPAYEDYPQIDSKRKPLSHVIYVERGESYISAVIQFFGVVQFYCHLGNAAVNAEKTALFATLDPVTGTEEFFESNILDLEEPDFAIPVEQLSYSLQRWCRKFEKGAAERGATNPPDLNVSFDIH